MSRRKQNFLATFTHYQIVNKKNEDISNLFEVKNLFCGTPSSNLSRAKMLFHCRNHDKLIFYLSSVLIRKKVVEYLKLLQYKVVCAGDYYIWVKIFSHGEIFIIPEKMTFYRRYNSNHSTYNLPYRIKRINEGMEMHKVFLEIDDINLFFSVFP
ncbi:MAG: hypothetical protein HRT87_02300 [Legionellales bacterium]|nr:hypothetical protein [Legionellales bacterium]